MELLVSPGKIFSRFFNPKNFERARPAPPWSGTCSFILLLLRWFGTLYEIQIVNLFKQATFCRACRAQSAPNPRRRHFTRGACPVRRGLCRRRARPAALPPCRPAALPPCCPAALLPCRPAALLPCRPVALPAVPPLVLVLGCWLVLDPSFAWFWIRVSLVLDPTALVLDPVGFGSGPWFWIGVSFGAYPWGGARLLDVSEY